MVVRIENLTSTVRVGPVGNLTAEQVEEIVALVAARLRAESRPQEHERGDDGTLFRSSLPPLRTD